MFKQALAAAIFLQIFLAGLASFHASPAVAWQQEAAAAANAMSAEDLRQVWRQVQGIKGRVSAIRAKGYTKRGADLSHWQDWVAVRDSSKAELKSINDKLKTFPRRGPEAAVQLVALRVNSWLFEVGVDNARGIEIHEEMFPQEEAEAKQFFKEKFGEPLEAPAAQDAPKETAKERAAAIRSWSSADGRFKVDAEFLGYSVGTVRLRKSDGTEIKVPLDKLSQADKDWIEERKKAR